MLTRFIVFILLTIAFGAGLKIGWHLKPTEVRPIKIVTWFDQGGDIFTPCKIGDWRE